MVGEIANSIVNMASCRTSTIISSSRPGRRVVNNIVTWHTSSPLQILRSGTLDGIIWIFRDIRHRSGMISISLAFLVINQVIFLGVEKQRTGRAVVMVSRVIEGLHAAWKPTWNWQRRKNSSFWQFSPAPNFSHALEWNTGSSFSTYRLLGKKT